jgi:hypothetical protein
MTLEDWRLCIEYLDAAQRERDTMDQVLRRVSGWPLLTLVKMALGLVDENGDAIGEAPCVSKS